MVNEPTHERLSQLGLNAMALAWKTQQSDAEYGPMPFDERLGLIVDAEWLVRENKRVKRRLAEAKLKIANACFEGIDFPPARKRGSTSTHGARRFSRNTIRRRELRDRRCEARLGSRRRLRRGPPVVSW